LTGYDKGETGGQEVATCGEESSEKSEDDSQGRGCRSI